MLFPVTLVAWQSVSTERLNSGFLSRSAATLRAIVTRRPEVACRICERISTGGHSWREPIT